MCSILFEGCTYVCAKNSPWSTRIKNKHTKSSTYFCDTNYTLRHALRTVLVSTKSIVFQKVNYREYFYLCK